MTMTMQEQPDQNFRSPSPTPSVHYESSYLKRMSVKPPPSLSSIQNRSMSNVNGTVSVVSNPLQQGIPSNPMYRTNSFQERPKSATPLQTGNHIRSQSPINMILDNARRRSATPVGTRRLEEQRNISASPISFYRSPSPTFSVRSQPLIPSYSQRFQQPTRLSYQNSSPNLIQSVNSVQNGGSMQNQLLPGQQIQGVTSIQQQIQGISPIQQVQNLQPVQQIQTTIPSTIGQQVQAVPSSLTINIPPAPVEALSPNSQDALINSPDAAISPSAKTEVMKHSTSTRNLKSTRNLLNEKEVSKKTLMSHKLGVTSKIEEDSREDQISIVPDRSTHEIREKDSNENDSKDKSVIESNAIKFDPENPQRYWTQLGVRVSSEILKGGSGRNPQKYAEAAQLAIIRAGESYYDASPETINLVASKASMAVLRAGGDARTAALATVSILNAENNTPSTEEEVRAKMVELYGSAKHLMKKGYKGTSEAITNMSEVASTKLKDIASENMRKYQDYKLKAEAERSLRLLNDDVEKTNPLKATVEPQAPGFLEIVDTLWNGGPRYAYRSDAYPPLRSRSYTARQRRPERRRDHGYSSDEDSVEYDRRRRNRRLSGRRNNRSIRSRSLSSSYSDDDSTDFGRPRRYKARDPRGRKAVYDDDDYSLDDRKPRKLRSKSRARSPSVSSDSTSSSTVKNRQSKSSRRKNRRKKTSSGSSSSGSTSSSSDSSSDDTGTAASTKISRSSSASRSKDRRVAPSKLSRDTSRGTKVSRDTSRGISTSSSSSSYGRRRKRIL